ncbi:hypothetical protein Tco_0119094, partial [Tanacetum coccineum]
VRDCKIDHLTQQYEKFSISSEETINSIFTRFNAIVTSLKSLVQDYSRKNHVRKFLGALPLKWRAKVMAIKEAKDLVTLTLDELIGNLKVYEMILENDDVASKNTKEKVKSLALKAKVNRSSKKVINSDMAIDLATVLIGSEDAAAFVGRAWSDSEDGDEPHNDATCLMAVDSQEVCLKCDLLPDDCIVE